MRNIFLFLRRYITFLTFIFLQAISLWLVFRYNKHHRAVFLGAATEVTGRINSQMHKVDEFINQGEEARRVHRMNDSLLNLLPSNYLVPETTQRLITDTLAIDTSKVIRRYVWRDAQVVYNTINFEKNYLQLNRGSKYGIADGMAVISSSGGVAGVVVSVSPNFSHVMSLLHVQMSVSAEHKPTNTLGKVEWDGKNPETLLLKGISKSVLVKRGDSVVTSRYSYNFPANYLVGTIKEINTDPATGFYMLKVKPAVNFSTIQQVFVVENLHRQEQMELAKEAEKKVEQPKGQRR